MRQRDERVHHRFQLRPRPDLAHERAIDLKRLERKFGQIAQARVPGAEVVDCKCHSERAQAVHCLGHLLDPAEHHRLRELDLKQARVQAGVTQHFRHLLHKRLAQELETGYVYRNLDCVLSHRLPLGRFAAGALHHIGAQRHNQTRLLGNGNEFAGRDPPQRGMCPARQCLEPHQPPRRHLELGLIFHVNPAVRKRAAKLRFKVHALAHDGTKLGREEHHAVLAGALRRVHSAVGVLQQQKGARSVFGEHAHTDAGADRNLMLLDLEGRGHHLEQPSRHQSGRFARVRSAQHHREFVAAQPGKRVRLTHP